MLRFPMHRPTRQRQNLAAKLARKQARSRRSGAKARRWKKVLEGRKDAPKKPSEPEPD
jgi:hypothetical protein